MMMMMREGDGCRSEQGEGCHGSKGSSSNAREPKKAVQAGKFREPSCRPPAIVRKDHCICLAKREDHALTCMLLTLLF
jgi:hypothetical protein